MDPKRPRSPGSGNLDYPAKQPKTAHPQHQTQHQQHQHLQINYLARQYSDTLPLVSTDDTLPAILRWIGEYDGVLHRHESIAGNLGACPLGPILVKRFERLFDGPPRVIKTTPNGSDGKESTVSWLDVVEFAKEYPEKFTLEKSRTGSRVCQLDIKHARVEISEEDYVLIASGMPQKMIPPQPISEDEEKELGALEILEKNLVYIIQLADQVSARARQLNHRLKNRRNAIVSRRENDASLAQSQSQSQSQTRAISPWKDTTTANGHGQSRTASPPGFVAVNSRQEQAQSYHDDPAQFAFSQPISDNVTIINGTSIKGASPSTRAELMKKFFTTSDRRMHQHQHQKPQHSEQTDSGSDHHPPSYTGQGSSAIPPVPIPNTPSSLLPHPKPTPPHDRDDTAPFKPAMVARMEDLARGERILPPCDRCRRLNMHCLKNLTACMGCTKKHAKCSWRDVKAEELHQERAGSQETGSAGREKDRDASEDASASVPEDRGNNSPGRATTNGTNNTRNNQKRDRSGSNKLDDDSTDVLAQAIMDTFDHHRQRTAERERSQQQQQQQQQQREKEKEKDREKNKEKDRDRERANGHVVEAR
ncbi:hypothetical protein MferCBS31731_000395 [Microsporum ferrugineum]